MFLCDLPLLIEGYRRQAGLSVAALADRMGWAEGTLTSYMHRLRRGRRPSRDELAAFARGLADSRFELGTETVVRNHLHAAAQIDPTPEEVAGFLAVNYPTLPDNATPAFVYDTRGFVRWISRPLASLTALLGGVGVDEGRTRLHAWVLKDGYGRLPQPVALDKAVSSAPAVFDLDASSVRAFVAALRADPYHLMEILVDSDIGGTLSGEDDDAEVVAQLEVAIRSQRVVSPDFLDSDWFGPIHRRISGDERYREALRRSLVPYGESDQDTRLHEAMRSLETDMGPLHVIDDIVLHDPRFLVERLIPGSRDLLRLWQEL